MADLFKRRSKQWGGLVLILILLVVLGPVVWAQEPEPPPTWLPADIYKTGTPCCTDGDPIDFVDFTITVVNRSAPGAPPKTNLVVTDAIHPRFTILSVTSTMGTASFAGQLVTVTVNSLAPGQSFEIVIRTRFDPPGPDEEPVDWINVAVLYYVDENGDPQGPFEAQWPVYSGPCWIPEPISLILLGGGLAGLAGYVGLRRRKG